MAKIIKDFIVKLIDEISLAFQRKVLRNQLKKVSSVVSIDSTKTDVEIMSLVSHYDLPLFLTAIKTLYYNSNRNFLVTVLDDGTFTEVDISILYSFIKNVRYISRIEADTRLKNLIKGKKYCQKFRKEVPMARKLIDLVFLSRKKRVILLDSDIIFFNYPSDIISWIDKQNGKPFFMNDGKSVYLISEVEAQACFGLHLIPRVNTGFTGFNTELVAIDFVEKFLSTLNTLDESGYRMWKLPPTIEQTFLSLIFSTKKGKDLIRLPNVYNISAAVETPVDIICRHYVTPVRRLFYSKAIRTLKEISLKEKINKAA